MFGWEFPPHNAGGLGVACKGLVGGLYDLGVDVTFVLPQKMDVGGALRRVRFADPRAMASPSVEALYNPYLSPSHYRSLVRFAALGWAQGSTLFDKVLWYARQAGRIARREPHDVIHAHDWLTYLAGIEAKRASGKPLVVHVHATEFDRTGNGVPNQDVYEIEKMGMEAADRVIAVSQFTKRLIVERYGIPEDKISVVHNMLEPLEGARGEPELVRRLKAEGKKLVVYIGRLTIQKGPDYFLRAAKLVLGADSDAHFIVAGTGDMEEQMKQLAAELGIADRVTFLGFIRGAELSGLYGAADVFVMPSISEPFGLTCLEAQSVGLPSVISRQSGVSEVARHCFKFDFWDVDDAASKILSVLSYPALKETMAAEGRRESTRLSWTDAARRCLAVYEDAVGC